MRNQIFNGESITDLASTLKRYNDIVKYNNGQISNRGGISEILKGNGGGFERYPELNKYEPYYTQSADTVVKWAKWRTDGIEQMHGSLCPFCTTELNDSEISSQNTKIKTVFKKSALETAYSILEYLKKGIEKGYIQQSSLDNLTQLLGDSSKKEELKFVLNKIGSETEYLYNKMEKLINFRPMTVSKDQIQKIEEYLKELLIEYEYVTSNYGTTPTKEIIDKINDKINELLLKTNDIKKLFGRLDDKLNKLITLRKNDINSFLTLAGFPYEFEIISNGEKAATSFLVPRGKQNKVDKPEEHLSWGEKNAFALVMFLFDAVNDDADFIVLDDPISSFDVNKKFAVMRRLFDNKAEITFRDKTILFLTHDLQPVIDYVYTEMFTRYGLTTKVNAFFLSNENGYLRETQINKEDLKNVVSLTDSIAKDSYVPLFVRIVNLRKYIELNDDNYKNLESYELLSNLIHGREIPTDKNNTPIPEDLIKKGIKVISETISGYSNYSDFLKELTTDKLYEALNDTNNYYKILAIRALFERGSKGDLLHKLRKEYPGACKFLNESYHIENDYVFQLNPQKYFSIPEPYLKEISLFLENNKDQIN